MGIFWRLVLAHFIADFTFQTNKVADWKRKSSVGMIIHIATHPIVTAILVWPYLSMPWVTTRYFSLNGWICILLLTFLHWLEDIWRVWSIQHTGTPDNTAFFAWDQVVHVTMILAFSPTQKDAPTETWVILLLCLVLLTHFTSVLIYFLENDLWGSSQVLEFGKYRYMGERVIGASLFLLPGPFFLLAFGWLGWIGYLYYKKSQERTWVHLVVGSTSVILLGLVTRGLLS